MPVKAVILAGGLGSRISEETYLRPKPMVMIGDKPILWHIMKKFSSHGIREFVVCLGYKGEVIKEYFLNFKNYNSDFCISTRKGTIELYGEDSQDWNVTLIDTGPDSNTGERLARVKNYVRDSTFYFTYGDGLTDQNFQETIAFHNEMGKLVTLTAVNPPARYGAVTVTSGVVDSFSEKTSSPDSLINGGFFLVNPDIFETLEKFDNPSWELDILPYLAENQKLAAFEHQGFWFAMDTLRDKEHLESLWGNKSAPWLK